MLIEKFEQRRLFAVTVTETYFGYWEIHGDSEANVISVAVNQNEGTFTFEGQTYAANYVSIFGHEGDDTISVGGGGGNIGAGISAGDGNDTVSLGVDGAIWGGNGADILHLLSSFRGEAYGEDGDDYIYVGAETIDAEIVGGDGNDFIDVRANNYGLVLQGGLGNDMIYGSGYNDQLYGGGGFDFIFGGGGNDNLYDGAWVDGGSGSDIYHGAPPIYCILGVEHIQYS